MTTQTSLAHEILYAEYKCPNCYRIVPNWVHLTRKACKWCDIEYHTKDKTHVS